MSLPWRARLGGGVALVVAVLAPVVAYVGNLGFAPLIAAAGMASALALHARRRPWLAFALLAAAALFAAASYGWGAVRPLALPRYRDVEALTGLKLLLQAALYGAFVWVAAEVSARRARLALLVLAVGLLAVVAVLLAEAVAGAPLYQLIKRTAHQATRPDLAKRNVARGLYAVALLLWPAILALRARGWTPAAAALAVGASVAALLFRVDAPVVALVGSSAVFLAAGRWGPRMSRGLGAGAAAFIATAPWLALALPKAGSAPALEGGIAKASWRARVDIWRFVGERIAERPFGWGLDGSRVFPHVVPLHPHDLALQVWLELGAPGAVLAAAFWWLVLDACADLGEADRWLGAAAAASATAYLVIGALSFGAWQEWWLALGALTAAVVAWSRRARNAFPATEADLYRRAS